MGAIANSHSARGFRFTSPRRGRTSVHREYGIRDHRPGQYEIDHLVPLELGGSNSIANLFPQRRRPRPGFRDKDRLENAANSAVCDDGRPLRQLQRRIARDWTAAYISLVGPLSGSSGVSTGARLRAPAEELLGAGHGCTASSSRRRTPVRRQPVSTRQSHMPP